MALLLDDPQWAEAGSLALLLDAAEAHAVVVTLGGLTRGGVAERLQALAWPPGRALAWAQALALAPRTLGHPITVLETLAAVQQQHGDAADGPLVIPPPIRG